MTVQNLRCQGGRIVTTTTPQIQENYSLFFNNSKCHGLMAPSFRRKVLVCFYCNRKSSIKYDGLITQWECGNCESMNYLDEVRALIPKNLELLTQYRTVISRILQLLLNMQLLSPGNSLFPDSNPNYHNHPLKAPIPPSSVRPALRTNIYLPLL